MHCSWEQKKKIYFILPHPLKNYLIFSLTLCLSLSLSLSLSSSPKTLSSFHSLSVTLLSLSIASPSQAANRLTVTLLSADPAHRPIPSTDPARWRCVCLWLVIIDFVWSSLRKKKLEIWVFFFFFSLLWTVGGGGCSCGWR